MLVADRYRLGDLLGRGGMGEVWRASDEVLGRQVAVKLLLGNDGDESAAMRFRMEAQTAARLNHHQVVGVYDFGAWDGRFYLVMELVQGPSLAQELSSAAGGALAPARVADIAAQAAAGLAAAHRQGVVHRDVKPGNLMTDADGTLKIGDFGIARFVDETSAGLTSAGQIVGTSTYLAPERALGRAAGPGSDVYALGCVLYQLLVGQPPFWADTPTALLYQHVDSEPVPPRQYCGGLPSAFEEYLLRMLAKRPEDRPTAQEAADWFGSGSWRDTPQPLPVPAPAPVVAPAPALAPERESLTTYALPATGHRSAAGRSAGRSAPARGGSGGRGVGGGRGAVRAAVPRGGTGGGGGRGAPAVSGLGALRARLRRHKVLFGVVAGGVAFVAAMIVGASLFGPDVTGSQGPEAVSTDAPGGSGQGGANR
ncbi:serine/threonine-protein kinase [Streptomyces varsoviensis]|uniref:serine/threonine-protein kinase n=1 Tax=Streptomyces varsoviensis TaxID=67373 RepID=UPI001B807931|nr:serine/threonine-protein kinase [Streptomyces varsoviensis]